jgi:hypothetical protein
LGLIQRRSATGRALTIAYEHGLIPQAIGRLKEVHPGMATMTAEGLDSSVLRRPPRDRQPRGGGAQR